MRPTPASQTESESASEAETASIFQRDPLPAPTLAMALFTKKDLGLLLPDDRPGDPASLRHTRTDDATETFKELKPKVDPSTKVKRYRAGQVPDFAVGYEEERGFVTANHKVRTAKETGATKKTLVIESSSSSGRRRVEAQVIASRSTRDDRLQRRNLDDSEEERSDRDSDAGAARPKRSALDDSSSEEDDDEIERRREALRRKMKERETQQPEGEGERGARPVVEATVIRQSKPSEANHSIQTAPAHTATNTDTSSSDTSGSEWETDSDASDEEVLMKPVFVPKKARGTIKSQEQLEAEEEQRQQREIEKAKTRKLESRKLVAEELQREKESAQQGDVTDTDMPDDTDGIDPEQEYRDWELREMRRIKRDRDQREARRKEAEETLRRRNMTEEERRAEDEKLKKNQPTEKKKLKFLQKYYHKGAFYMDDSSVRDKTDVRRREATEATLEDKFNKEMLPAVMQVKNFGRAGRTKYTHLAAEDTSTKDALWNNRDAIRDKFRQQLSGTRELDSTRSSKKKQRTE
ncbi:hypothetical protein PINS_up003517 [Pythium insidiosum]|nr:hypothetical protein PINS_up003517 [Pythium insidiosum]